MQADSGTKGKFAVALWHGAGEPPPARLLVALRARGIGTVEVNSAYAALAEVCARAEAPLVGGKRSFGVVAVYPERLPDAPALWEALARYAPGTRCWGFGPAKASNQRLTPIVEKTGEEPGEGDGAIGSRPRPASSSGAPSIEPKLKLTGPPSARKSDGSPVVPRGAETDLRLMESEESGRAGAGDNSEGDEPLSRQPLLSAEELSMLLDDDRDDRD